MTRFDVFNGDADGLCALRQLRLAEPAQSVLVTGVKRDIGLLARVPARGGDEVTVLDVSMARNREALLRLLAAGVRVRYFDHHAPGDIPAAPNLETHVVGSRDTCTSLIVDRVLEGRFGAWAVAGAFGDNLHEAATRRARSLGLGAREVAALRELGEVLNYNAYGDDEHDQIVEGAALYRILERHASPLAALREEPMLATLRDERRLDLERACATRPERQLANADAWLLPDAAWSRRAGGEFANWLARVAPLRAHAVVTRVGQGYRVSLRTPEGASLDAAQFCARYPTGGGRVAAAGIDAVPAAALEPLLDDFARTYG